MEMETGTWGNVHLLFSRSFGQKAKKARGIVLLCLTFCYLLRSPRCIHI